MKRFSALGLSAVAVLFVPFLSGDLFAQSQTQVVNYSETNTTSFTGWTQGCCFPGQERCGGGNMTLTWTDTIGVKSVRLEVRFAFGTQCASNPTMTYSLNSTTLTPDTQPGGLNAVPTYNCACPTATQASGRNFTLPATNSYTANGSNSLVVGFNLTGSCNCLDNNSSGWCVQVTIVNTNSPPAAPTNLQQAAVSGGGAQPVGFISDNTIFFRATVTDPNATNTVGLEAEVLPTASTFGVNPTGTLIATPTASFAANGSVVEAALNFSTANLPSGSYKWRVRGKDNAGAAGPWVVFDAAPVHFITDLVPPTSPTGPFQPTGVQLVFNYEPQGDVGFSWGAAVDPSGPPVPVSYRLEVSASDTFSTIMFDTTVPGTSTNAVLPAGEFPYFWRVHAVDAAGNFSAPSAAQPFMVSWTIPPSNSDNHAHCGVSTGGGSALMAALAVLSALFGVAARRRRAG